MRLGVLAFSITMGSGQSRFAINLSRGLVKGKNDVTLFAYSCSSEDQEQLFKSGIEVFAYKSKLNTIDRYRAISDSKRVFLEILRMINSSNKCDYYLVLSDELIGISNYRNNEKWIYLSNGDLTLLFMNQQFLNRYYPYSMILKRRFITQLIRHQKSAIKYDYLLANSQFTKSLMSFFFNVNFIDYIYPPVDAEFFKPTIQNNEENYALVMLRSNYEPMASTIERIAKTVPIKIVGDGAVKGGITLGRISDQDLVKAYSNATLTIGSSMQEFFGYSTAESLACGTPVIAFNQGGAAEMIQNSQNGWLVQTEEEMLNRLIEVFKRGYDRTMREKARESSNKFSIPASAKKLIDLLK